MDKTSAASSHLKAFCANFQLWQSNSSISNNNCDNNNNNEQNAKASSEQKFLWRKTTKIHLSTFKVCMCCSQLQQGDYLPSFSSSPPPSFSSFPCSIDSHTAPCEMINWRPTAKRGHQSAAVAAAVVAATATVQPLLLPLPSLFIPHLSIVATFSGVNQTIDQIKQR